MKITKGYDFDDVLLLPRRSDINSRDDVDISTSLFGNINLKIPIIASPMKGIINFDLAVKLSDYGIIGILHKFYDNLVDRSADIVYLGKAEKHFGAAIGLDEVEQDITKTILDSGAEIICIDMANGYISSLLRATERLNTIVVRGEYKTRIMAGNVVTLDGATELYNSGADLIRVGIGSGALCTTRLVTGIGCPQLTAIENCSLPEDQRYGLIADGGIRNSGDIVKALAFGADAVMIGSMLARAIESAHNGIIYGMASRKLQEEYYHNTKSIEGIEKTAEKTTPLFDILDEISWGIKSACTYLNASNLDELRRNATYIAK